MLLFLFAPYFYYLYQRTRFILTELFGLQQNGKKAQLWYSTEYYWLLQARRRMRHQYLKEKRSILQSTVNISQHYKIIGFKRLKKRKLKITIFFLKFRWKIKDERIVKDFYKVLRIITLIFLDEQLSKYWAKILKFQWP